MRERRWLENVTCQIGPSVSLHQISHDEYFQVTRRSPHALKRTNDEATLYCLLYAEFRVAAFKRSMGIY